ncbi:MAG TPA: ankyrin repeat domain-containing protein [Longimicrobiales bacterium]
MYQPAELKSEEPLFWSPGRGTDVWAMFQAAIAGDVPTLERLVAADPALARCHYEYRTPLAFAVKANQVEAASYLFDLRPPSFGNPLEDARERGLSEMVAMFEGKHAALGVTPAGEEIAAAVRARDRQRVGELLDASPESVHAGDRQTNRPIHWAVMTRQLDLIDELLARGADIEAQRADGARPIQLANGDYAYRGWRDVPEDVQATPRQVLDHLRARGAYVDICTASYIGDLERVRELLAQDASLANRPSDYVSYYACSGTPLPNAARGGHIDVVRLLLEHGADPNLPEEHIAPRGHALYSAVYNDHMEIARLLLEKGAFPNVEVESSADTLTIARSRGNREMIDLLVSYGAAQKPHLLAYEGDAVTAAAVFAANPSLADDPPALANAAGRGSEALVRLMLRYVPDLPTRLGPDARGKTREITELLIRHGMDVNRRSWMGVTPLHHCAEQGDVLNAAIFIDRGADLDARDDDFQSTPLAWAARKGKTAMVELLLARGARPNPGEGPFWTTPLAWASRRGHHQVVHVLRKAGARS